MNYQPLNKNVQEDLQKLGYKDVSLPVDADLSGLEGGATDSGVNQDTGGVQSPALPEEVNTTQQTIVGDNQQVVADDSGENQNVQQNQKQLSQEEIDRRSVQSERDKLRVEVEESNRKNEYIMQMLAGITGNNSGNLNQANAPVQQQPLQQDLKEPQLSDFINESDYDPDDANDPRTRSGRALGKYNSALRVHDRVVLKSELKQEVLQDQQQLNQQSSALKQAHALANKYPEFKNPFTQEPDIQKIQAFIQSLSSSDEENLWADLYEFKQSKSGKSNQNLNTNGNIMDKIGSKANQVSSVAAKHGAEKQTKALPKEVQDIAAVYGGLEIPEGAIFE